MAADDITAQALTGAGVSTTLAAEIIRSLKTGKTTNAVTLSALGLPGPAAIELASQINARVATRRHLYGLGIPIGAANAMGTAIAAGVV